MSQAQLQKGTGFRGALVSPTQPFFFNGGSVSADPHYVMSPICSATGHKTTGLTFFVLVQNQATFVQVWKRESVSGIWARLARFTPPDFDILQWMDLCDLNACELYFESDGVIDDQAAIYFVQETSG